MSDLVGNPEDRFFSQRGSNKAGNNRIGIMACVQRRLQLTTTIGLYKSSMIQRLSRVGWTVTFTDMSVPIHERKCSFCNSFEDEYHFVLQCSAYSELRKKYISKYFWNRPNMFRGGGGGGPPFMKFTYV